jgi:hypothetical protein
MQLLNALKKKKYRLLLIIGRPGSGKSKYLQNYSKQVGIPILDLDFILGKQLPDGRDADYVYDFLNGFLDTYKPEQVLIDKKAILYNKDSKIDLLDFLKELSLKKIVIATWNGYTEDGKLIHVCDKLQKDFEYDLSDDFAYIELK